ncbi:MAG: fibronectin type III domain-containing protein, partial [Paludibacteraceae bacterium]|nr:fibronectin type III domain-containing protein [Paludibacteraceae bacterium]
MKRLFFTFFAVMAMLFTAHAQTPAGYAIFGPAPHGYTNLTESVSFTTTNFENGTLTGTGLNNITCQNNVAVSFSLSEAKNLELTKNFALHIVLSKITATGKVEVSLCNNGWNTARASWDIANASIEETSTNIALLFSDRIGDGDNTWRSHNTSNIYDKNKDSETKSYSGEILRICAAASESFEITQIYIKADETTPDPVPADPGDEDAPTDLTLSASNIQDKSVTLTASANDEASLISYEFFYKAEDDADFTSAGTASAAPNANAVKVVSGLTPETTYSFKVIATDPSNNPANTTISNVTTASLIERRYYFFRGDPASVSLPSEGVISHDLRKGQTPGTNISANRVALTENKYYSRFMYVNDSWFSFDQSFRSSQDLSEVTQAEWYLVLKFRTTFSHNSFNIRLCNANECWQVSQTGEKGQLSIDQTGEWNTLTLPLSSAMKTLNFTSSMSGNILQFHSNSTSTGMYLDIAYAYLTNNAASVDDLADNVAPAISSVVDGDKTTSSVVLTVTASDD